MVNREWSVQLSVVNVSYILGALNSPMGFKIITPIVNKLP